MENGGLLSQLQDVGCSTNLMGFHNPNFFDAGEESGDSESFTVPMLSSFPLLLTGCCPGSSLTSGVAVVA